MSDQAPPGPPPARRRYSVRGDMRVTGSASPIAPTDKLPPTLTSKLTIANDPRPIGQQILRLGGNLRPRDIQAIYSRADNGYMQMLCDLGDDSKQRDSHLAGILHRRENAIAGVPWQIIPGKLGRRAIRIAAFVEKVLLELGQQLGPDGEEMSDFRGTLVHLNGALFPGYAHSEVMWRRAGRYLVPMGTIPMSARRFIYSINGADLRWWDESGSAFAYPGIDVIRDRPMGRFLRHRPRINGGVGPREGFIRPLCLSSYFRTWTMGDWYREGELAAKPYRIATYDSTVNGDELYLIDQALEMLTANGWTRMPKGVELKIQYPEGIKAGQNIHEALAQFLASEESKLVLGSTLTSEPGKVGTQALGKVHANVTQDILELDARQLEATIRRYLIVPLVIRNFGPNAPIPEFRFLTEDQGNLAELSKAIAGLVKSGLRIPAKWVRATFGIPEPENGDELVTGETFKSDADGNPIAPMDPGVDAEPVVIPGATSDDTIDGGDDGGEDDNMDISVGEAAAARLTRAFQAHAILCAAGSRRTQASDPAVYARHWLR